MDEPDEEPDKSHRMISWTEKDSERWSAEEEDEVDDTEFSEDTEFTDDTKFTDESSIERHDIRVKMPPEPRSYKHEEIPFGTDPIKSKPFAKTFKPETKPKPEIKMPNPEIHRDIRKEIQKSENFGTIKRNTKKSAPDIPRKMAPDIPKPPAPMVPDNSRKDPPPVPKRVKKEKGQAKKEKREGFEKREKKAPPPDPPIQSQAVETEDDGSPRKVRFSSL